jgi:membrane fusion protein (multidrug efflux system)
MVRARIADAAKVPAPGASVRVLVPAGPPGKAVAIPVSALRKGPGGDQVFVISPDKNGKPRAHVRPVRSGEVLGDTVLVHQGLEAGELVATSGSFKLRDSVLVALPDSTPSADGAK